MKDTISGYTKIWVNPKKSILGHLVSSILPEVGDKSLLSKFRLSSE